ncbi:MAG: YkgJ family cysteine cluster protein [Methanothrix sp.]|nr:YkgJ family cysteine cluster protein [Methanothrix sp.]
MPMPETPKDPRKIAIMLLKATALPDEQVFIELATPKYTSVDYYRMACHMLFECQRCGKCCTTGDPIRLRPEDAAALAKHLKVPLNRAIKKYTIPDPDKPGALDFKHTKPCKFYDVSSTGCKIYTARPWSCRIFPFLGIYGSEEQVIVNKSCPGSLKTMETLTAALQEVRAKVAFASPGLDEVRRNKELLRAVLESV